MCSHMDICHMEDGINNFFKQYEPSIDFLEMYAILIFLDIKAKDLQNFHLQFFCDNQPMVDTLTNKFQS